VDGDQCAACDREEPPLDADRDPQDHVFRGIIFAIIPSLLAWAVICGGAWLLLR